jgi:DnaK suppressor protein
MDDVRRHQLRLLLTRTKQELLRAVRKSMAGRLDEDVRFAFEAAQDIPDQSVDDLCRHIEAALTGRRSEDIDAIDAALRRLAEGSYGICDECGEEIPEQRLSVMPFAVCCVECQQRLDRRRAGQAGAAAAEAPQPDSEYLSDKE